ncbi:MAG: 30S ribosomal protein S4 [Candidatus Amoebophilus sp. 36-38]|nr:MAG: 30S ribosomal protein S4 [Candidatus Amoebophilus sp. 36-38]
MARYIGPKSKISRRFNEPIFGPSKALQKKSYPPGQHGRVRKKKSEYAIQLMEKGKAKYIYGLLEKQFSNLFHKAAKKKGVTGELLLQFLETRLDNVVYRLGITPTRRAARQLVSHKHITVNDQIVNIPSYALRVGDMIGLDEKAKSSNYIVERISNHFYNKSNWLEWDSKQMKGKIIALPNREEIPEKINEQSIVELYSK